MTKPACVETTSIKSRAPGHKTMLYFWTVSNKERQNCLIFKIWWCFPSQERQATLTLVLLAAHLVREDHINGVNGRMLHWVRLPSSDGLWGLSCVYTMTPSHLPLSCQPAIPAYFSRGQLVFHCIIWASSVTPSLSVRGDESDESVWVRRVYLTEGATTQSWSR